MSKLQRMSTLSIVLVVVLFSTAFLSFGETMKASSGRHLDANVVMGITRGGELTGPENAAEDHGDIELRFEWDLPEGETVKAGDYFEIQIDPIFSNIVDYVGSEGLVIEKDGEAYGVAKFSSDGLIRVEFNRNVELKEQLSGEFGVHMMLQAGIDLETGWVDVPYYVGGVKEELSMYYIKHEIESGKEINEIKNKWGYAFLSRGEVDWQVRLNYGAHLKDNFTVVDEVGPGMQIIPESIVVEVNDTDGFSKDSYEDMKTYPAEEEVEFEVEGNKIILKTLNNFKDEEIRMYSIRYTTKITDITLFTEGEYVNKLDVFNSEGENVKASLDEDEYIAYKYGSYAEINWGALAELDADFILKVVDEETKEPLEDLEYVIENVRTGEKHTGVTDKDGTIVFENLPGGEYDIEKITDTPEYVDHDRDRIIIDYGTDLGANPSNKTDQTHVVELEKSKSTSDLEVIYEDEEGNPVVDSDIVVKDKDGIIYEGSTGSDGRVVIENLPNGDYTVEYEGGVVEVEIVDEDKVVVVEKPVDKDKEELESIKDELGKIDCNSTDEEIAEIVEKIKNLPDKYEDEKNEMLGAIEDKVSTCKLKDDRFKKYEKEIDDIDCSTTEDEIEDLKSRIEEDEILTDDQKSQLVDRVDNLDLDCEVIEDPNKGENTEGENEVEDDKEDETVEDDKGDETVEDDKEDETVEDDKEDEIVEDEKDDEVVEDDKEDDKEDEIVEDDKEDEIVEDDVSVVEVDEDDKDDGEVLGESVVKEQDSEVEDVVKSVDEQNESMELPKTGVGFSTVWLGVLFMLAGVTRRNR